MLRALSRRDLLLALAGVSVGTLLPGGQAVAAEQRIVALEWLTVELLLALGIQPLGVADIRNYRHWVSWPALAKETIELGLRTEPNLELLVQLRPSLILHVNGYGPSATRLATIASTLGFDHNRGDGAILTTAIDNLHLLAARLQRQTEAAAHLRWFEAVLASARAQWTAHRARPLLIMSLLDKNQAMVFGPFSLFGNLLQRLALTNAFHGATNFWGSALLSVTQLANFAEAEVFCLQHGDNRVMQQVTHASFWQALPFVRQRRFHLLAPVWCFGATFSALHFCQQLGRAASTL